MELHQLTDAATLFGLALLSVALWTTRVSLTARHRTAAASVLAATEAVVFALAFSRLLTGIDDPVGIAAHASGVAAGTALALGFAGRRCVEDEVSAGGAPCPPRR